MANSPQKEQILIIEDDLSLSESLKAVLDDEGYLVECIDDGAEGYEMAKERSYALVVTDYRLPGMGGLELLERLREDRPKLPVVMMTSHGTADLAIGASKVGAFEYLIKPFDLSEFLQIVDEALRSHRASSRKVELGKSSDGSIVGSGRAMQEVFKEIGRAAPTDASVLVMGGTGTGKELVARAIYQHSKREAAPFIAVNCGAIPEGLLESELFGHLKGSFTGAVADRPGRFEQADGGTLFLDEIGEMPVAVQVKLLRVLQEQVVQPLGSTEDVAVNVRIIAATNRDLEQRIAAGEFRSDLFFRLNTVTIRLPDLAERKEDIADLVAYFASSASAEFGVGAPEFSKASLKLLKNSAWPGNVRQLENVVRRSVLAATGKTVEPKDIEGLISESALVPEEKPEDGASLANLVERLLDEVEAGDSSAAHATLIAEAEQELIEQAIDRAGGNQSRAAEWLGLSRVTLRQKLRKYEIEAKRGR